MHKYVAVQREPASVFELQKDGITALCPKLMFPVMAQTRNQISGQVETQTLLNRLPCSTACPFATLDKQDKIGEGSMTKIGEEDVYVIECEGGCKKIVLDEIRKFSKPSGILTAK